MKWQGGKLTNSLQNKVLNIHKVYGIIVLKKRENLYERIKVRFMYKCFDKNGKVDSLQSCRYIVLEYERDLSKIIHALDYEDCEVDGLNTTKASEINFPTAVKWNCMDNQWNFVSPNNYPTWLSKLIGKPVSKFVTHELANTKEKLYNLHVIFKTGITFQTNTEPVTFEEIAEAIEVLQKPSIFGEQIAEFKIEVL